MSDPSSPAPEERHGAGDGRPAPAFIACGARSGSTLLRWLIDSHPQLSCPGESDLALLLERFIRSATALSSPPPTDEGPVVARARAAADALIAAHLNVAGKERLCDKSLSNALHLELLATAWPDARFVLLHRQPMDFVMSAIDGSPWGLSGYGFGEWAQRSPTDTVVAMVGYWLDRTRRLLAFEERFADRCLRLRYEDLVANPEAALAGIWQLLAVPPLPEPARAAFAAPHHGHGGADHKVWYTDGIHEESVGRGARVPPQLVTSLLRNSVNELAERLGYATIDDYWGSGGGPPAALDGAAGDDTLVELRILDGQTLRWNGVIDLAAATAVDGGATARSADAPARTARIVVIERATLAAISAGSENIGGALRARTVRSYGPRVQYYAEESEIFRRLAAFLGAGGGGLLGPDGALTQLLD